MPTPIQPNQNFIVNVTVRNIGGVPAGQFAVAGTFPPNNTYLVALVPGLAPGQSDGCLDVGYPDRHRVVHRAADD